MCYSVGNDEGSVSVEVRPASLFDIPALSRLQSQGIPLDPQRTLTRSESPLWAALRAPLTLQEPSAYTYLARLDEAAGGRNGFVQACGRRADAAEAEITYIAPALDANALTGYLWARMLEGACWEMAALGIQRVFASLPADSGEAEPFLNAGFVIFAREELLRGGARRGCGGAPALPLRPQRPQDAWALQRLCAATAPIGVRQAEGLLSPEGPTAETPAWGERERRMMYVAEVGGSVVGRVQVVRGKAGQWIHFTLHPERAELAEALVEAGLRLCESARPTPLYSHVRTYESALRPALLAQGFEAFGRRDLVVRQAVARIKEPALVGVRALEPQAGMSATPSAARVRCQGDRNEAPARSRPAA